MRTKHLFVLARIRNKGEGGIVKHVKANSNFRAVRSKVVLLL